MNKSEQREVNKALGLAARDVRYAAVTLATLHRSATSARSQHEIAGVIRANPALEQRLQIVNGCYVERA